MAAILKRYSRNSQKPGLMSTRWQRRCRTRVPSRSSNPGTTDECDLCQDRGAQEGKLTPNRDKCPPMNILVIDVGGTHVKILASGEKDKREIDSGPTLTARQMVSSVKKLADGWEYDVVSIGYPGPVVHDRPMAEPHNLGKGWMGFNFAAAFKLPTKVINDAAMQALGSYRGGKMLFLGLGTGLGSAIIVDGIVQPMELGHLPYKKRSC